MSNDDMAALVHTQRKKYLELLKKSLAISEEVVYIMDNEER